VSRYFDPDQPDDLRLVMPRELRESVDVADIALSVEKEVIEQFQQRITTHEWNVRLDPVGYPANLERRIFVMLEGYHPDADQAYGPLRDALKRTIADVVSWRIQMHRRDRAMIVETQGDRNRSYRRDAGELFPSQWEWRLRIFDLRQPPAAI
jgi:hypothetical protein